jgi:hypothetical protein
MSDQTPKEDELTAEEWAELRQQIAEDRNALFDQVSTLTARCEAAEAILQSPEKWMQWCDEQVLARCEALTAERDRYEAGLRVIGNLASHPETGDALIEALVRDTLTPAADALPDFPNPNHK